MHLYLLILPALSILIALLGRWRKWSLLPMTLLLLALQLVLVWWLPIHILLVWAQSLQIIGLFTFTVAIVLNTSKQSEERLMGQVYFALFNFFTLAVLLMPILWQEAVMAILALLVLVVWFIYQRQARTNLGIAVINWFFTVVVMAMQLHLFTILNATIIGVILVLLALLGVIVFYHYRFWLTLWFFCFHLGLVMLLLWAPGASGLVMLLHLSFFLIALMLVSLLQYLFQESTDELQEYENGTIITLGFWRTLAAINAYIFRLKKGANNLISGKATTNQHASWIHVLLLLGTLMLWCIPPTVLFLTLFLLFSQVVAVFGSTYWVLGLVMVVFIIFTTLGTKRLLSLWLQGQLLTFPKITRFLVSAYATVLVLLLVGSTFWLPDQLMDGLALVAEAIR